MLPITYNYFLPLTNIFEIQTFIAFSDSIWYPKILFVWAKNSPKDAVIFTVAAQQWCKSLRSYHGCTLNREANNLGSSCLLIAFFDFLHLNGLLGPHARLTRLPSCFENGGVLGRIPSTRVKFPFGGLKTNSLYVYF